MPTPPAPCSRAVLVPRPRTAEAACLCAGWSEGAGWGEQVPRLSILPLLPSPRHLAISPDEIGKLVLFVVATVARLFVQQRVRAQPQAGDQPARLAVGRRLPPEPGPGEGGVRVGSIGVG